MQNHILNGNNYRSTAFITNFVIFTLEDSVTSRNSCIYVMEGVLLMPISATHRSLGAIPSSRLHLHMDASVVLHECSDYIMDEYVVRLLLDWQLEEYVEVFKGR